MCLCFLGCTGDSCVLVIWGVHGDTCVLGVYRGFLCAWGVQGIPVCLCFGMYSVTLTALAPVPIWIDLFDCWLFVDFFG